MSKAISVVVIGRSLNPQERTRLRSASHTPLAIVAELPNAPQVLDELNRLRPQAALVLLNGDLNHSFQLVERIHQEIPETAVICSSEDSSPDIILQSFRSGATEFLRQPLVESEIASVFAKIEQTVIRPEESHLGRVIAVFASKGGCGTTFVTANLAASLARLTRKRACIIDLNLQAGDQPLFLGLEPHYSIHDVVRNFDRLDDQLIASYLTQRSKYLSLLAAPTEIGKDEDVRVEHITRSIALLRGQADYVVIDPPRILNETTISALDAADDLLLLLTLDIPAIRSAKRTLDIFTRLGYDRSRIKVVINRYTKTPEFDIKQIEKVLETPVFATIANDYQAAIGSINVGEPLVISKTQSRIVTDFANLASKLTGVRPQVETDIARRPPKKTGLLDLFSRKG
ncbi:MAG: AAA family ATPase [Acidobacteria bacterium]|nr:AAA family ATPase [Acidobacteriota bacterium]